MIRDKKKVRTTLTIIVTLLICIGFGLLASNLYLNSNFVLRKNSWNVHFENLVISDKNTSTSVENDVSIDSSNNKLINYTAAFEKPGEFYEFTVDIKNDGSVDTMVDNVELLLNGISVNNSNLPSYIEYSLTYSDGVEIEHNQLLKAGEKDTYKVRIGFKYDITNEEFNSIPSEGFLGDFSLVANYLPKDNNAVLRPRIHDKYSKKIVELSNINTEGVNISTNDHNNELRFIGSNPNNYVIFNNEASCDSNNENCSNVKWRIIGVFDGKLKLIRDSIGGYSWDTSGTDINNGYGVNQWGPSTYTDTTQYDGADLMKLLNPGYESNQDLNSNGDTITVNNSLYWNGGSGLCYDWGSYRTKSCNFTSTGLTDTTSRNMIDDATWYLGSNSASINIWPNDNFNGPAVYTWERQSTNLGKQCSKATYCSDTVNRTPTWTGKVGLLYPSDYIYATSGGSTYDRDTCLSVQSGYASGTTQNWTNTYTDCYSNDWLKQSYWYWSLSPRAYSDLADLVFDVTSAGCVGNNYAYGAGAVRPVVFIKSSVTISGGNGTQSSPYYLQ